MNKLKKNFLYSIIYQILILIIPFITTPYLSRVVGAEGIGIYSYTYSIAYYFTLFCLLGVENYGNRSIAKSRDNREKLSKNFWSIYILQLIMGILMVIIYFVYVVFFDNNYKTIALIQSLFIIASIFDINWLFFGLEEFKVTITRNIFLKIVSVILIFAFVKNPNDLSNYVLIISGTTIISQIILWIFVKKYVDFVKISIRDVLQHIKPNLILFIPVIAVSLYKIMDKIMLGKMANMVEVGYYEQAEKIINIPITIVTALGTVMLPRISNLVTKNDKNTILKYIYKSEKFMMFLAFPLCFGLISISDDFVTLFMGNEFIKSSTLINYLAFTIIFVSFANVIRKQYLVPMEKDKDFIISVIGGAVINLIINCLLIPHYQSIGACIATIIAEVFVMIYQCFSVKKELPIFEYVKCSFNFFIKSLLMFIVVLIVKIFNFNSIVQISIQIIIGSLIYLILNYKYICSFIDLEKIRVRR